MSAVLDRRQDGMESGPLEFLSSKLPVEDWTLLAKRDRLPQAVEFQHSALSPGGMFDALARVLYRRSQRHLFITGLKGVGKTTVVRELARRAAQGEIPFLADRRFLWIDASNIGPEDSRGCLETILMAAAEHPRVVLCLDGIDALLKRPQGGDNKPLLRAAARREGLQIIGILSKWAYQDLIGMDAEMLELFTRVEVEEPHEAAAFEIAQQAARRLEHTYSVTLDDRVVERAVLLSANYILNQAHPAKAIRILEQACDELDYERTQCGRSNGTVTIADICRIVGVTTGIPESTLMGEACDADYEAAISARVVGQEAAVQVVANEFRLIKAGLTDPGKPASVLLFAGLTGVGKTELAKRLSELYSTSKRLNTYAMGNYTEPHSVSGIIGVPPGYVGHEHGGRLINELNADPYSVFLLDEAEKAHPNVWKPFLNLFDEGWIEDQRGVRAHADRAIFILTTNAGDQTIAQMARSGRSAEEISEHVKNTLSRVRHERSSQPVFTPQFLARIRRILVFAPLAESAMTGICRKQVQVMQTLWKQHREKSVDVPESLIEWIGHHGYTLNEKSSGKEGGRIIRKLISEIIELPLQMAATQSPDSYRACQRIQIDVTFPNGDQVDNASDVEIRPDIIVQFLSD